MTAGQVDKPIIFTVDRTGCKGQMDCKVVSPSGHEDDCFVTYLDDDTYSVRFLPKENGIHQVSTDGVAGRWVASLSLASLPCK